MKITKQIIETVTLIKEIAASFNAKVSTNVKTGLVTIQFAKDQVRVIGHEFATEVHCTANEYAIDTHESSDTVTVDLS
jgi:hypothetical protein